MRIASNVRLRSGGLSPKPLLVVWLPERRADFVADWLSTTAARGGSGSPEMVAEYERLTGQQSPTRRAIGRLPYGLRKRYPELPNAQA